MIWTQHYSDVIMGAMASQITSRAIVYSTVYSDPDKRKYQSSASLAFVRGIHRSPVNSPHKWPVTRKMFPFDDVIMKYGCCWCPGAYMSYADVPRTIKQSATVWSKYVYRTPCLNIVKCPQTGHKPYRSSLLAEGTRATSKPLGQRPMSFPGYWDRVKRCQDVMTWTHFPHYWTFVWGIHRLSVNFQQNSDADHWRIYCHPGEVDNVIILVWFQQTIATHLQIGCHWTSTTSTQASLELQWL